MKFKPLQKYFFFLIISITSCQESSTIKRPDVSKIDVEVKIDRFDQLLSETSAKDVSIKNKEWLTKYPYFYTDYMLEMLELGNPHDSSLMESLLPKVLAKKDFKDLNAAVQAKYPTLSAQEKQLNKSLKYIKYFFPEYKIPKFISFIGGFSFQTPIGEDYVGIGLDMFLGSDSEFYPSLVQSIPLYISKRFTPENIVPRVIESILREELYPQVDVTQNTLQYMIYNGKILYVMDVILEDASDNLKIGYTEEQLKWAQKYQSDIWAWFVEENLLYNTDYLRIQKYFTEAPFTPELGEKNESAPKLGSYIGWMIVRKYMDKNPDITLTELLSNSDAQEILEKSKFKGK